MIFLITGDRIASVKISFRSMVYEDALTILSYASPYDVELEVESGGSGSKPTTLLKKSVGPSPTRICHPLYRSQSIPELSQAHKTAAKRLFIADPNESLGSNYSTMNSTLKSSKSTPGSQTLERHHEEAKHNHHKFGIKVLPALDGTVHRIENQNEHNTNLERRHSRKMDAEKILGKNSSLVKESSSPEEETKVALENLQQKVNLEKDIPLAKENIMQKENLQQKENIKQIEIPNQKDNPLKMRKLIKVDGTELNGIDLPDTGKEEIQNIPSEVPTEVHNAAMAARRNRKNSSELMNAPKSPTNSTEEDPKSPQKNKRKAPAPPKMNSEEAESPSLKKERESDDKIDSIADYTDALNDYVSKVRENKDDEARRQRLETRTNRRNSESDTDSEIQNSFTTIELNPADITIHHTPVPEVDDDDEEDDIYRKAASLGDLSKYESKASTTLERAQSLDMTDTGSKKRKAPLPPEDINESTEDLTKLDQIDTFDRRKLKKSSEWGTLEDAIWAKEEAEDLAKKARVRKKSNGTLERSKSAVEIKMKEDLQEEKDTLQDSDPVNVSDGAIETSIDLYNLPLSKRMSQDFIHAERMFNPDEDNSLARIVNNGRVVKSPTPEEVELDFRQAKPVPDVDGNPFSIEDKDVKDLEKGVEGFEKALRYFDFHSAKDSLQNSTSNVNFVKFADSKEKDLFKSDPKLLYKDKEEVEEVFTKVKFDYGCPACDKRHGHHDESCTRHVNSKKQNLELHKAERSSDKIVNNLQKEPETSQVYLESQVSKSVIPERKEIEKDPDTSVSIFQVHRTKFEQSSQREPSEFETHFAKRIVNVPEEKDVEIILDDQEEDGYDFGSSITVNNKNISPSEDRHNISNVSVSSGENSEDSGLIRESIDFRQESETRPPLPSTPMPLSGPQKMTYITEIKVSPTRENMHEPDSESEEIVAIMEGNGEAKKLQVDVVVTSNGKPTPGKKPPVPPRRSDVSKLIKDEISDKQVVYVSEYKPPLAKEVQVSTVSASDDKPASVNKKFEQWIFLGDNKEQNPWGNGSSPPQPVTNIVLSSGDEKILHQ